MQADKAIGFVQRFAFQEFHSDVGRAVIGLAGLVNGDNVGMMNATRGGCRNHVEAALRRHGEENSP